MSEKTNRTRGDVDVAIEPLSDADVAAQEALRAALADAPGHYRKAIRGASASRE